VFSWEVGFRSSVEYPPWSRANPILTEGRRDGSSD
jgi:hypothetical protein